MMPVRKPYPYIGIRTRLLLFGLCALPLVRLEADVRCSDENK